MSRWVAVRPHGDGLGTWLESDAVVARARWRQSLRLGEDGVEGVQQLVEEGRGGRGGADVRRRDALDARPADRAALLSEGHGAALEVPRHRTQRAKPLHAQNNIVPCQHHDEQVGAEDVALY